MANLLARIGERSTYDPASGCLLWSGKINNKGYGLMSANNRQQLVHRLAYEAMHGMVVPGLNVLHRCDTPRCWEPEHLWLGTQRENVRDMRVKGRGSDPPRHGHGPRGERHPKAKLTEHDVREIRTLYATGDWTHRMLADRFGVHKASVGHILTRRRWRHV